MNILRRYKWFTPAIVMAITLLGVQSANAEYDANDPNIPDANYPQDRIIVRFEAIGAGEVSTQDGVLDAAGGGTITESYEPLVNGLVLVTLPEGSTVDANLEDYNSADGIMYAEPDYEVYDSATTPDDTYFSNLWGMHNTGQTGGTTNADINAPEAWDEATSAGSIIVAVIDTGVDWDHEDLASNMWVNTAELNGTPSVDDDDNGYVDDIYGYDFCNNDGNPDDDHYHGTHCAGTVGAIGDNGTGVTGVCWDVQIMAVKFLNSGGSGYWSDCIQAIQYAKLMGADVMSNSYAGFGYSQGLYDAIFEAGQADIMFVAAAGNYYKNNDTTPFYPASYDLANIISVTATDHDDAKPGWAHWGATTVDLAAPGVSIKSSTPSDSYGTKSGTSMACPHVAGACALYWAQNPGEEYTGVKNAVLNTVDQIASMSGKCVSEGRLNLEKLMDVNDGNDTDDIDPETFDGWGSISDFMSYYMVNSSGVGYWGSKKYVKATFGLIDSHCKTAAGTKIPHYHFESNLNTTQKADSNRYWDWYYNTSGTNISRISDANNLVASLAHAMDGYGGSGSANFDYWLVPSEDADNIFTDDCTFWQGPPHDCRAEDRIAYEDNAYVYQHSTIINSIDGDNEPNEIEWKCQYSGVYQYDNDGVGEPFATPGRANLSQPDNGCNGPSGTWDADYWDTDDAHIYYD